MGEAMSETSNAYVFGSTAVVVAMVVTLGWSPNCQRFQDSPDPEPVETTTDTVVDEEVLRQRTDPDVCKRVAQKRNGWIHTRMNDCERMLPGEFLRCMWWIFGGHPPSGWDGTPDRGDVETKRCTHTFSGSVKETGE